MSVHLRTAGGIGLRSAGRGPRPAALLLAVGSVALLAGLAILGSTYAPMFGIGDETSTVVQPGSMPAVGDFGISGGVTDGLNVLTAPALVDRPANGVAFQMRVPALHYSAKVLEGVDRKALAHGPGHYPATAWPGRDGTVGVAAHNVYWLSFNRLKAGDRVELQTTHGLYVYVITGSKITTAGDVAVLAQTAEHRLVLTTCYPLWAGALATKRLVFFAREIGGVT